MKTLLHLITLLVIVTGAASADTKVKAGPRKGRVLEVSGKSAEFFVEKDRKVSIAFYDTAMKSLPLTSEVVDVTAEAPNGKVKLEFEKKGELLLSKTSLPDGEGYNVVVQIKPSAEAKTKNFRILLLTHVCKSCGNAEYACICDE